jgi:hypothetical protein
MQAWLHPQHTDMRKNQKPPQPDIKEVQKTKPYQHTIRWPGENLSIISKWYTGSVNNWKIIAQTNPKIHANSLGIGTILLIPADIVIRRQSMPRDYLIKFKRSRHNKSQIKHISSKKKKQKTMPLTKNKRPNRKQTKKKVPVNDLELFAPVD